MAYLDSRTPLKIALAVSLSFTTTYAAAYFCPKYIDEIVRPVFAANTAALISTMASVDAALSVQLETNSQRLQSAIAVMTKQKAIAANQIADAERVTAQSTASGLRILAQTEAVKKAKFDYSGEFGQGVDPCGTYSRRVNIANQDAAMGQERRYRVVDEVVAGPGRYGDPIKAADEKVREHEAYCTADQAASGLCKKAGPMAGASPTPMASMPSRRPRSLPPIVSPPNAMCVSPGSRLSAMRSFSPALPTSVRNRKSG